MNKIKSYIWSWVPITLAITFTVIIAGPWLTLSITTNDVQVVFRSIFTPMVSLMGLGIAIVILATQLSTRYGYVMAYRVFAWPTIIYFTIFIVLILFCFSLGAGFYIWKVPEKFVFIQLKIAIIVFGILMIFLIPYLRWLVTLRLNPENTINQEAKKAAMRMTTLASTENGLVRWPDIIEYIKEIRLMDNILITSIGQVDILVINQVIAEMYSLALRAYSTHQPAIGENLLARIQTIIMSRQDVEAFTNILTERIQHSITYCIEHPDHLDEPVEKLLGFLTSLGKYALRKNQSIDQLFSILGEMTNEAISRNLHSYLEMMMIALQDLRKIMIEEHNWNQLFEIQDWFFQITHKALEQHLSKDVRNAVLGYQDVIMSVFNEHKLDIAARICEDVITLGTLSENTEQPEISEFIASILKKINNDIHNGIVTEAIANFQKSTWAKRHPEDYQAFHNRYIR